MASPGSAVANGRDQIAITVTLRDTSGAPLAGRAVRLEATGTGNYGFIESLPTLGGPGQVIARDQGRPIKLEVDGANLYWLDNCSGALMTSGTDGSNVRVLASGFDYPFDLALDTGIVYVSDRGGIWTVPR